MYLGDTSITNFKVGDSQLAKICLGTEVVWSDTQPVPPTPSGLSDQYLTFDVGNPGSIYWVSYGTGFTTLSIDYSINGGPWTTITSTTAPGTEIPVNAGDIVRFRGQNDQYASGASNNTFQGSTADISVYGNIMSMIYGDNFSGQTTFPSGSENNFSNFFRNCKVYRCGHLVLPATALTNSCYQYMFYSCSTLSVAPELPATTLANNCYLNMFGGCTSLETPPPVLPADSVPLQAYKYMFRDCTYLSASPDILASTFAQESAGRMFYNASNLHHIKCLATSIEGRSQTLGTSYWVSGVGSGGIFTKHPDMHSWSSGNNGIPLTWTIEDAVIS